MTRPYRRWHFEYLAVGQSKTVERALANSAATAAAAYGKRSGRKFKQSLQPDGTVKIERVA